MSKITLTDISHPGDNTVVVAVNNNNTAIRQALENTLSRDGTSPNEMEAPLDMNSERIINLPSPATSTEPVRLGDMPSFGVGGTFTPLPAGGTAGQGLVKNSGTNYDVSWGSVSATPGGSNTQLQYNNAGSFAGITNVTTNGTNIALGTPTSGTLTNCTGLPVSTGVSGLGTSVATALAIAVGSAGAVVVNGGALGTPSSGTLTNCTSLPAASVTNLSFGQCRLSLSGGNLLLSPYGGNLLSINGTPQAIPSAGVTLSASGLTPSTLYYIYAFMNSGTMTLEASTTAYATSSTTGQIGVVIKSADATRTLVGMARPVTGPAWVDSGSQRFVISYFNRRRKTAVANSTALRSVTNAAWTEFNSELRCEFLTWATENVFGAIVAAGYVGTASQPGYFSIGFDGTTPEPGMAVISDGTGGAQRPVAITTEKELSEGYHYLTALGGKNASTSVNLNWGANADGDRANTRVVVFG